ncbi:hypothetical protein HF675_21090 [Serratia sp. JUb9]|uniref:hypothetical protein n=1 Tax=Serratia sp. JUb9 TaxID=2724469 RepID=UPI000DA2BC04|nr:hypothetical protein [Serratia sp. JUb9]MBU3894568.1 hypothetical protein [Serratia rubidaea]QNK32033.1 hypothetical protein HF675_21090 [Serratia sp. JUb9]SQJ30219.1 Uncharacterised protein [Serratia rubidaea]
MMQDDTLDRIVNAVLMRMRPRLLLLLTAADGYHEIILARLQHCRHFAPQVLFADRAQAVHPADAWRQLGHVVTLEEMAQVGALENIDRVIAPFLDFATAAEVAHDLFQSEAARCIQLARLHNTPVLALDYNCNPHSELNRLKGLGRSADAHSLADNLPRLAQRGIQFCSLDQMLSPAVPPAADVGTAGGYITLSELKQRNGRCPPGARLTDLALEYQRGSQ